MKAIKCYCVYKNIILTGKEFYYCNDCSDCKTNIYLRDNSDCLKLIRNFMREEKLKRILNGI